MRGERHETEFVDDEELEVGELLLEPQQLPVVARFHELVDLGSGGSKADREALLAGCQTRLITAGLVAHGSIG